MATIIEKDSGGPAALLVTILIIFLIAGGVWFAYANGALGGKTTVIENKTVVVPVQTPAPASAPESPKP
jgi:hypothetical protein